MFEISVTTTFSAAHAIMIRGVREPLHGHDWRVTAVIQSSTLDSDGMVCDFHELAQTLNGVISPFKNNNLNIIPPFDSLNPTAEHVAMHIGKELQRWVASISHTESNKYRGIELKSASVTEAVGCEATYRP